MKELIILGAGGTAFDLVDIAHSMNKIKPTWNILGFLDDNLKLQGTIIYGYPVIGTIPDSINFTNAFFVSSIGDAYRPELRKTVRNKVPFPNNRFASLVHPTAVISDTASVGEGVVIYPNVTLSSMVKVGHDVFLCGNTFLGHECEIGNHCILSVGNFLASDVHVGDCCYLGVGVMVRHQLSIGQNSLIGMGSKLVKNVKPYTKIINKLEIIATDLQ
ncbi:MAG: hypothetical protein ACOVJ8_08960 [Sediminibacterium sp.]|jgi:sugar O-acyltransferase (sialic acid O-acetyltransferase NeuD family)